MSDLLFNQAYLEMDKQSFSHTYWANRTGIPFEELPHAGPQTLPPPIMEGQTICFRLYDDTTADYLITAHSVQANGLPLQWVETEREKVPRRMVGTYNAVELPLETAMQQLAAYTTQARERWLRERFESYAGHQFGTIHPERFAQVCLKKNLKFERRTGFTDGHEELWVNGKFDSAFTVPKLK